MLNYQLNGRREFHPRCCGSRYAIPPDRCYVIIAQRRGGMGGQAHVPSFLRTSILNFISMEKEFSRAEKIALYQYEGILILRCYPP
jgi:hypothetical protein